MSETPTAGVRTVDRISDVSALGAPLRTPEPPADAAAFVTERLAHGRRHRVRVRLHVSGDLGRELIDPSVGSITDDGDSCVLAFGTDNLDWAARWLVYRNVDFDVLEPAELTERLRSLAELLAERYA